MFKYFYVWFIWKKKVARYCIRKGEDEDERCHGVTMAIDQKGTHVSVLLESRCSFTNIFCHLNYMPLSVLLFFLFPRNTTLHTYRVSKFIKLPVFCSSLWYDITEYHKGYYPPLGLFKWSNIFVTCHISPCIFKYLRLQCVVIHFTTSRDLTTYGVILQ